MIGVTYKERHQAAIQLMHAGKQAFLEAITGVAPEAAFRGTEWSVADVVRHLEEYRPGSPVLRVQRLLEEPNPELPPRMAIEEQWQHLLQQTVEAMDELIAFVAGLTEEQLARTGQRSGRTVYVIDMIETYANHFEEHAKQISDEIRPRLDI